jgi:CheY-like chemotaxis protein
MLRILLADDEPWLTESLAISLEARGFECTTVTNMSDCVISLRNSTIAALVTDVMMPPGPAFPGLQSSEAGFHLIEYVQKHWPDIPIVCLSVIADEARIRFLKKRRVRYLRKGETPLSTAIEVISSVAQGKVVRLGEDFRNRR